MTRYRIEFVQSAKKEFGRLPVKTQDRVIEALHFLSENPFSELLNIKRLRGTESLYRVRFGDYRLVYEILAGVGRILVIKIGHRREIYRHL